MKVELTKQQIKDLLFIVDNSSFKGVNAEKVVLLKKALLNGKPDKTDSTPGVSG